MSYPTKGRRGHRKGVAIPANLHPEHKAFFEQVIALLKRPIHSVGTWYKDNVAGTATVDMEYLAVGSGKKEWTAPRDGWVATIWVKSNEARTAGTLTLKLMKSVDHGTTWVDFTYPLRAILDATHPNYKASQAPDNEMKFNEGDEIKFVLTTAGWTPTTADISAGMEVRI